MSLAQYITIVMLQQRFKAMNNQAGPPHKDIPDILTLSAMAFVLEINGARRDL